MSRTKACLGEINIETNHTEAKKKNKRQIYCSTTCKSTKKCTMMALKDREIALSYVRFLKGDLKEHGNDHQS